MQLGVVVPMIWRGGAEVCNPCAVAVSRGPFPWIASWGAFQKGLKYLRRSGDVIAKRLMACLEFLEIDSRIQGSKPMIPSCNAPCCSSHPTLFLEQEQAACLPSNNHHHLLQLRYLHTLRTHLLHPRTPPATLSCTPSSFLRRPTATLQAF